MVVALHIAAEIFYTFDARWNAANVFDSWARACVPLFFMCSGAMLLQKDVPIALFYRKRVVKIFPPLFFWAFLYLFWYGYLYGEMSFYDVVRQIFYGSVAEDFHLWFLYAIVGLYMTCPFLRKMYKILSNKDIIYIVTIWFVIASVIPCMEDIFNTKFFISSFNTVYFTGYIGYFALGIFIYERIEVNSIRYGVSLLLYLLTLYLIYYLTSTISIHLGKPSEIFYSYLSPVVVVNACLLFFIMLHAKIKNTYIINALTIISKCSYGIYCIHIFFNRSVSLPPSLNTWIYIPLKTLIVFGLSFFVIYAYLFIIKTDWKKNVS